MLLAWRFGSQMPYPKELDRASYGHSGAVGFGRGRMEGLEGFGDKIT